MTKIAISEEIFKHLLNFLKKNRNINLITAYLSYLSSKHDLDPVVFMKEKKIFLNRDHLIKTLEAENKLWRKTEIKIQLGKKSVTSESKKIYICPYSGKTFANNTHPNPQDAIYEWVSKCPENTERKNGIKIKKFFISEDPEIIKSYITPQKTELTKIVFSSVVTGKLFHSKKGVIQDLLNNHIKSIPIKQVTTQNRFDLHEDFLQFLENYLEDSKISVFVEELSKYDEFDKYITKWMAEAESEAESESKAESETESEESAEEAESEAESEESAEEEESESEAESEESAEEEE